MINLAVVNVKKKLKSTMRNIIIIMLFLIILFFGKYLIKFFINKQNNETFYKNSLNIFKSTSSIFSYDLKEKNIKFFNFALSSNLKILAKENFINNTILVSNEELPKEGTEEVYSEINNNESDEDVTENTTSNEVAVESETKVEDIQFPLQTEVISSRNLDEHYNTTYGSVKIKNESKYNLTEEILKPDIEYSNKKDMLIFHTHTCESYTPTENSNYEASGNFRTTDLNYSVAKVGSVLTEYLKEERIQCYTFFELS